MDKLSEIITTPAWWVSTVVVAFLVNIIASYGRSIVDIVVARWSQRRRDKLHEIKKRDDAVVMYLTNNPQRLIDLRTDATFSALRVILALSLAVFWTTFINFLSRFLLLDELGDIFLICLYVYFTFQALRNFRRFRGLRRIADKCNKEIYSYDQIPIEAIEQMKSIKRAFDPKEILNRGNLFIT